LSLSKSFSSYYATPLYPSPSLMPYTTHALDSFGSSTGRSFYSTLTAYFHIRTTNMIDLLIKYWYPFLKSVSSFEVINTCLFQCRCWPSKQHSIHSNPNNSEFSKQYDMESHGTLISRSTLRYLTHPGLLVGRVSKLLLSLLLTRRLILQGLSW
jgi:hypothetical protein